MYVSKELPLVESSGQLECKTAGESGPDCLSSELFVTAETYANEPTTSGSHARDTPAGKFSLFRPTSLFLCLSLTDHNCDDFFITTSHIIVRWCKIQPVSPSSVRIARDTATKPQGSSLALLVSPCDDHRVILSIVTTQDQLHLNCSDNQCLNLH